MADKVVREPLMDPVEVEHNVHPGDTVKRPKQKEEQKDEKKKIDLTRGRSS